MEGPDPTEEQMRAVQDWCDCSWKAGEARDNATARSQQIVDALAALLCLPIATTFYTRNLPREVCDLVYAHLVYSPTGIRIGFRKPPNYSSWDDPEDHLFNTYIYGDSKDVQPKYFAMNPKFVGLAMAKEVTEAYYSQNRFHFTDRVQLRETLAGDPFNTGVMATDHIHQITLQIQPPSWLEKDRLVVRIELQTQCSETPTLEDERGMYNILEMLRQPVYDLMHAGSGVCVTQWNSLGQLSDDYREQSLVLRDRNGSTRGWVQRRHRNWLDAVLLLHAFPGSLSATSQNYHQPDSNPDIMSYLRYEDSVKWEAMRKQYEARQEGRKERLDRKKLEYLEHKKQVKSAMLRLRTYASETDPGMTWSFNEAIEAYSIYQCVRQATAFYEYDLPR
ncbi:hypothetical protein CC86DRAFT_415422 [Ophiobolus disseminans]|uniref:Uncharacterized protein n=1 Tax=Ophiobolus disseminans TaxID=1469910 RepID=A0A6A7ALZ4_9PLEO|nr:hypothetical protein CC86DRAFT_415422 [Ophiobolus disseminans]